MKRTGAFILFFLTGFAVIAQDTSGSKSSAFRHEFGFNALSLLGIVSFIEPPADQLPYDVFYNLYLTDRVGIRLGAGMEKSNTQTRIPGQAKPRETNLTDFDLRLGSTLSFFKTGALTFNAFGDVLWKKHKSTTVTTTTAQVFGDPVLTTTVRSEENTDGLGAQLGLGINLKIYKNLCIYTELPFTFLTSSTSTVDELTDDSGAFDKTVDNVSGAEFKIYLPATIYFVLRF